MKRMPLVLLIGICSMVSSVPAHGAGFFGSDPGEEPSVISYGFRGFLIGTLLGTSAGYLVVRNSDWSGDDWKDIGTSMGVGAIAGTLGGLAVGMYDLSLDNPGTGNIVLRDTVLGTGLGALVGTVAGGLFAIDSGNAEDMALGASVGSLCGAAIGAVIGFIEGPKIVERRSKQDHSANALACLPTWSMDFRVVRDTKNGLAYVPVLTKRF